MALRSNLIPDFSELKTLHCSNHSKNTDGGSTYLFCNEQNQDGALTWLAKEFEKDFSSPSVHFGFSFLFNLDLLSLPGSPEIGLIFDIDPNMNAIYQFLGKTLQNPFINSPLEFIDSFPKILSDTNLLWYPIEWAEEKLKELLSRKNSFLSSQENFLRLKKKFNNGQIFFGCADITNAATMDLIYGWMQKNKLAMRSIYLSNIAEWCLVMSTIKKMGQNINSFIQPEYTLVIDAFYPTAEKKGSGPPLRACIGQLPEWLPPPKKRKGLFNPVAQNSNPFEFKKEITTFRL